MIQQDIICTFLLLEIYTIILHKGYYIHANTWKSTNRISPYMHIIKVKHILSELEHQYCIHD